MRRILGIAVIVIGVLAGPVSAEEPSAEAMAAARETVAAAHLDRELKAVLPIIAQQLKPGIVQGRPEVARDFDALLPKAMEGLTANLAKVVERAARIYAVNFTIEELRAITAFHRSPAGRKLLQLQPVITEASVALGRDFAQGAIGELRRRLVEELRKKGHDVGGEASR